MSDLKPDGDQYPLTAEEKAELERCLEEYDRDPAAGEEWEAVRDQLLREIYEA